VYTIESKCDVIKVFVEIYNNKFDISIRLLILPLQSWKKWQILRERVKRPNVGNGKYSRKE